jgi:hypothetical protein
MPWVSRLFIVASETLEIKSAFSNVLMGKPEISRQAI